MQRCFALPLVIGIWAGFLLSPAAAQQAVARDDIPRFVLNTSGPRGSIQALLWSDDSTQLYQAGHNKVVNVWNIGFESFPRVGFPPLPAFKTLNPIRWDLSRANRGDINAIAISEVAQQPIMAIGGYCAWGALGDIPIVDLRTRKFVAYLKDDDDLSGRKGHRSQITSLSFSPDGKYLVSASLQGNVFLWKRGADVSQWSPQKVHDQTDRATRDQSFRALFLNDKEFVVSAKNLSTGLIHLTVHTVTGAQTRLPGTHAEYLTFLTASESDDLWASGDTSGQIKIWKGGQLVSQRPGSEQVPSSFAFLGSGRAVVGTHQKPSSSPAIELISLPDFRSLQRAPLGAEGTVLAIERSPDGARLAIADDSDTTVKVIELKDEAGNDIPAPLNQLPSQCLVLHGDGAPIRNVQFGPDRDNYRLSISQTLHDGKQEHTLVELTPQQMTVEQDVATAARVANQASRFANGWSLEAAVNNKITVSKDGQQTAFQIFADRQGQYDNVFCFLPSPAQGPQALAVGTNVSAGIFIYLLDKNTARLTRYFRDHSGDITTLDVTPDGKYLASGSLDQTVKLWSLEGLFRPAPFNPAWGASFAIQGGRVVVADVLESGVAYARGLRKGDQITRIDAAELRGANTVNDGPNQIWGKLHRDSLFLSNVVHYVRNNQPQPPVFITPGWEPMLTLFLSPDYGWAAFTPQGYYDASAAHGHRLFGWHFNQARNQEPRFELAANLQKDFERPDVIRQLWRDGSVPAALRRIGQPLPPASDLKAEIRRKAYALPLVTITQPTDGQQLPADGLLTIQAEVRYGDAFDRARADVIATVDDVTLRLQGEATVGDITTYTWQTRCAGNAHSIDVRVAEDGPVLGSYSCQANATVRGSGQRKAARQLVGVIAVGCQDYDFQKLGLAPLSWARRDANEFAAQFVERNSGQEIVNLKPTVLIDRPKRSCTPKEWLTASFDEKVAMVVKYDSINYRKLSFENFRDAVERTCQDLAKQVGDTRSDATLIVFVAGHGDVYDSEFYFVPSTVQVPENTLIPAFAHSRFRWNELKKLLRQHAYGMNIVFVLDACHSGAVSKHGANDAGKSQIRNSEICASYVLAACGQSKKAIEWNEQEHGLFTKCLLDGLAGLADAPAPLGVDGQGVAKPNDKIVSFEELGNFTRFAIKDYRRKENDTRPGIPNYTPIFENPNLSRDALPLAEVSTK